MASYIDPAFRESLLRPIHERTQQDLTLINANLKSLEALSSLRDSTIRSLCKTIKYEKHEANDVLYRSGDVINCWYILLSGSVFIDGSMYLPRSGFGRRSAGQLLRVHDCLVLETSEMLVIDYPKPNEETESTTTVLNQVTTIQIHQSQQMQSQHKSFRKYMFNEDKLEHHHHHQHHHHSHHEHKHLTTFKTLASSSSNSPILITNSHHEEIHENFDPEDYHEDDDLHNLNIACTDQNDLDLNESLLKDQQLKSICILTSNLSTKNKQINQQHLTKQSSKTKTFTSTQNESMLLDTSQQTISSCTNINTSINTIDTLDDDLNFKAINAKRMLKHQQHDQSCSSSISSSKSSSLISNIIVNNQNLMGQNQPSSTLNNGGYNTTGITASTSNSINDDASEQSSIQMITRDAVREVLEKDPKERTDEDIDILVEFMQTLPAFSNLTEPITRKLCSCMVLGIVDKADTIVLDNNEKLDSWAVVLNGQVECILPDSTVKIYNVGDHFGTAPVLDSVYHEGVMRTKCDDCQFVLVKQNDYYEILSKSKENTKSYYENNKLVMISEFRPLNNSTEKTGEILLRATPDKLIERLIIDESYSLIDPTYIQDFLLTYRVFIKNPTYISQKLQEYFQSSNQSSSPNILVKKKVYRIILEWITNHFNDFEKNRDLYEFIDKFQELLTKEKMHEQFRVLTIAISTKSKPRIVTLPRSRRDENLSFSIQGGWEKGYGIFVSKVEKDSKAYELGIRKGDQILEVNSYSFQHLTLVNALETLRSFTHASIKLKYNPIGFNEMLLHPEKSPHRNKKNFSNNSYLIEFIQRENLGNSESTPNNEVVKKSIGSIPPLPPSNLTPRNKSKDRSHFKMINHKETGGQSNQIKKFFGRLNRKTNSKDLESLSQTDSSAPSLKSITRSPSPSLSTFHSSTTCSSLTGSVNGLNKGVMATSDYSSGLSRNNSTNNVNHDSNQIDLSLAKMNLQEQYLSEHVLKIYKNDQNFKYLVVHKETSTKEVVMLALNEFNIIDEIGSNAYSLCEVSVDQDRLIKQKRLPDQMNNLAEKLPLNARYYLKSNTSPEQFLSDSASVEELIKDSNITFLQLEPLEVAAQLTLRDYCIFKSIESSEYIENLFHKDMPARFDNLEKFADLSNDELYWVINEILNEPNIVKRAKIIKNFIIIAYACKQCKNYNSLFAILSGLDNSSVTRLKDTWEKVSNRYKKVLSELKSIMDPSLNMSKYRNMLKNETIQPPIIPFFPICQKDLYFTNESSNTVEDDLINFEKLRKISKTVRSIVQMTCSPFDLTSMKDVPTSQSVIFSMFGCDSSSFLEFRNMGVTSHQLAAKIIKADHVKKLYEESVMVRKVRHYLSKSNKDTEKSDIRLRLISSTLENSTSGHTLKRRQSPNSSLGGSLSSINALNNSNNLHNISSGSMMSAGNAVAGVTAGNGTLSSQKNSLFGAHSPEAMKKLLALSETKVKTVKNSSSSSSVPLSHISHSRHLLNTSSSSVINSNLSNNALGSLSPPIPLSPKTKLRSISSSQPLNKIPNTIPLSNESSSVSTIKLNGKYSNETSKATVINGTAIIKSTGMQHNDADSGRASMASNVDQDQCSPTFQQRSFMLNKYLANDQNLKSKLPSKNSEMHLNIGKFTTSKNSQLNLEEEDQVSAV
ncbi:unnamed protein product [Brachionus calyciflorus]|uniref:Rap guanine nucleotide exchange factor 2 n=1 Tax=Brachionus calyciflorus TaxID=104777 RepID=A0A813SHH6_9BILA|nr:unnamed protein product [Brachionus calyciflorus]